MCSKNAVGWNYNLLTDNVARELGLKCEMILKTAVEDNNKMRAALEVKTWLKHC